MYVSFAIILIHFYIVFYQYYSDFTGSAVTLWPVGTTECPPTMHLSVFTGLANDSDRLIRNSLHVLKEVGYSQCYLLYLPLKCKNHLCHGFLSSFGKTTNINL